MSCVVLLRIENMTLSWLVLKDCKVSDMQYVCFSVPVSACVCRCMCVCLSVVLLTWNVCVCVTVSVSLCALCLCEYVHLCVLCRSCRAGLLLQCDYCPLLFHLDCLNPPLTALPSGRWMCPSHVEHALVSQSLCVCSRAVRLIIVE